MGIPKFMTWLHDNYGECMDNFNVEYNYDDIYIDMNYVIHLCYYNAKDINHLKNKIIFHINQIIKTYKPLKHLYLYFDGGSGEIKKNTCMKRIKSNEIANKNKEVPPPIDPKIFSHKSDFMKEITGLLQEKITPKFLHINDDVKVKINDSTIFGEGEIKMAKNIIHKHQKHSEDLTSNGEHYDYNSLIISNDSDSVIISLCNNIDNIYILNKCNIIDIDKIKEMFTARYNTNYMDFVLLSLFQGNDYFPKLKYISYKTIWEAYNKYIKFESLFKTNDLSLYQNEINVDNLKTYMMYLLCELAPQYKKYNCNLQFFVEKYNKTDYIKIIEYCINLYKTGTYNDQKTIIYNNLQLHPAVFLFN